MRLNVPNSVDSHAVERNPLVTRQMMLDDAVGRRVAVDKVSEFMGDGTDLTGTRGGESMLNRPESS